MFFSNSSFSRWNSVMYFCCTNTINVVSISDRQSFTGAALINQTLKNMEGNKTDQTLTRDNPGDQLTCFQPIGCRVCPHLLLVRQLLVLLGQDLGQVQVAHLGVNFGIFGTFLHEETKVRSQRFLREIWMSLNMRAVKLGSKVKGQRSRNVFTLSVDQMKPQLKAQSDGLCLFTLKHRLMSCIWIRKSD